MRMPLVLIVTIVSIAATAPIAGAQVPPPSPAPAVTSRITPAPVVSVPSRNMFRDLFQPVQRPTPQVAALPAAAIERPVVMTVTKATRMACGMTLIGGDPKLDPTLPHPSPERASQGAIRAIPADGCAK